MQRTNLEENNDLPKGIKLNEYNKAPAPLNVSMGVYYYDTYIGLLSPNKSYLGYYDIVRLGQVVAKKQEVVNACWLLIEAYLADNL